MPLFVIGAIDRPGRLDRRKAARGEHLQHLANHAEHIRTAGPFTDENGVCLLSRSGVCRFSGGNG